MRWLLNSIDDGLLAVGREVDAAVPGAPRLAAYARLIAACRDVRGRHAPAFVRRVRRESFAARALCTCPRSVDVRAGHSAACACGRAS